MNKKICYLIMVLVIISCESSIKNRELSGLALFKTKIKDIKTDNFNSRTNIPENSYFISYDTIDYKKLNIYFSWKNSKVQLSTLNLFFGVGKNYYRCVFDRSDFLDTKVFAKLILKSIDLESSKFQCSEKNISYNSDDFFKKISKFNKVFIFARIDDLTIMSNPLLSSPNRTSNVIHIALIKSK